MPSPTARGSWGFPLICRLGLPAAVPSRTRIVRVSSVPACDSGVSCSSSTTGWTTGAAGWIQTCVAEVPADTLPRAHSTLMTSVPASGAG